MRFLLALVLPVILCGISPAAVTEGEIQGAKYKIAMPEKWQGKLVLLAHGYRLESKPLDAGFDTENEFAAPLLEAGWGIASTSYRRNGWIVEDAILNLKALRDRVEKEHGKIDRCVLVGSSMGGLIGTLVAEGALDRVDGVLAIGAYLGGGERDGSYYDSLTYKPAAPVIFLTNETELEHPRHYRTQAGPEKTALWEVKRPGHCNVSDIERLKGVQALDAWIGGKVPEKDRDGTVPPPARPSTAVKEGDGLSGKVTSVSGSWGNLSTDFVAADLDSLGLKPGDKAQLRSGGKSLPVTVTRYWSEAKEGEGCIYVTPSGWLGVVINGGSAAGTLGVETGKSLVLSPAK